MIEMINQIDRTVLIKIGLSLGLSTWSNYDSYDQVVEIIDELVCVRNEMQLLQMDAILMHRIMDHSLNTCK
jgi:hypothetical protein